jgi:transposase
MLVDQDECWFSRFAQPQLHAFATAENNLRLIQREPEKGEPAKAIACYGAVCDETKERFFCFADGQPNSEKSIAFLSILLAAAEERCQRVLVVIWDRATWHLSKKVVRWIRQHNQQVKQEEQGVRLLTCLLPTKSPWLNPMEPIWLHAKRKVVEPDGDLSVKVLKERLCAHFKTNLQDATLNVSACFMQ